MCNIVGFGGALMAGLGMFLGGALTTKFHLKLHHMAALVVASNAIFAITLTSGILISCAQHDEFHITRYLTCVMKVNCLISAIYFKGNKDFWSLLFSLKRD